MLILIDDTYNSYGTFEELTLFIEAIRRWDIGAIGTLPDYMKFIYKTLFDVFGAIEEDLTREGRPYSITYPKKLFEQKRGHVPSTVECSMKQYGASEDEAIRVILEQVADAWKDLNEAMLKPTAVSMPLLERILNYCRTMEFVYKDDRDIDAFSDPTKIKEQVASLLKDPIL
ncbi:hypothetical protein Pint_04301 [Pistacia integerrima]|uniref:Uncharacterized protein n=1 Tax=Pistacia integerrima TaxID=434235 RepID=A0ACC0YZR9_9ROSI|nr:hypothetical protein Pint_04301 [Pistacia integerrima]